MRYLYVSSQRLARYSSAKHPQTKCTEEQRCGWARVADAPCVSKHSISSAVSRDTCLPALSGWDVSQKHRHTPTRTHTCTHTLLELKVRIHWVSVSHFHTPLHRHNPSASPTSALHSIRQCIPVHAPLQTKHVWLSPFPSCREKLKGGGWWQVFGGIFLSPFWVMQYAG